MASFKTIYKREATEGIARLKPVPDLTEKDITALPDPVQRYLRYTGALGKPQVQNVHAVISGRQKLQENGRWLNIHAQQYNFYDQPSRFFYISSRLFGIPYSGLHVYSGSAATFQIKLASLSSLGRSGVTRARKLASLREFFSYLLKQELLAVSPAASVAIPKKERKAQTYLRPEEYARLLSTAGSHPRDFAILQLFLQTGIRVSELVHLTLTDVDLVNKVIKVAGKGSKERTIPLEKKAVLALKNYLSVRSVSLDQTFFLNYTGTGLSRRGAEKILEKYRKLSGITKRFSCHSLRHTFGSYKAEQGVSPFQLKEWMGHSSISVTQLYVHMSKESNRRAMEQTSL